MSHQFPAFKLATLLARQLSSPISHRIKEYARRHPRFSRSVCGRTAEVYRTLERRVRVLAVRGVGAAWLQRAPAPLTDKEARDMGADILGEVIIFTFGSLIIIFEMNRQMEKQELKEQQEREAWLALLRQLEDIRRQLEMQQEDIIRLRALLDRLLADDDDDDEDEKEHDDARAHTLTPAPVVRRPPVPLAAVAPPPDASAGDAASVTPSATENDEFEKLIIYAIP